MPRGPPRGKQIPDLFEEPRLPAHQSDEILKEVLLLCVEHLFAVHAVSLDSRRFRNVTAASDRRALIN
jgi:hypothetical protein